VRRDLRLRLGLGLRLRLDLGLRLLRWGHTCLAALVFAAAPMSLRLSLAIGLDRPQFRLGLRQFCRHA
jgi:hypothetical protein